MTDLHISEPRTVQVEDLVVRYGSVPAVNGLSLSLRRGECLAIVGESGSGKSTAGLAILGYLPEVATIDNGRILLGGQDMAGLDPEGRRALWGRRIAMVYQSPMTALNPLMTVGQQLVEALLVHGSDRALARARAVELFRQVRMPEPETIGGRYPHQLSGGQLQRVVIAMAMSCEPEIIVMDEPTTGLDVTTEAAILELIDELRRETGQSVILISHNLGLVARHADRVAVMLRGEVVEEACAATLFADPQHDYTRSLIAAVPQIDQPWAGRPRTAPADRAQAGDSALTIRNLTVTYRGRGGRVTKGVEDIDLTLGRGEILAIVGESGSGKTTLSRTIVGLQPSDPGSEVSIGGAGEVAMVFQDPASTLNPARTIGWTLRRTLALAGVPMGERSKRASELLRDVDLPVEFLYRFPAQLSGGQRQRASIARALAQNPQVIIMDEPTSALDVSVQRKVLDLLVSLRERYALSILFVTHDLGVVRYLADRVAVMYRGRLVHVSDVESLFSDPGDGYVAELMAACMATHAPGRTSAALDPLPTA